MKSFIEELYYGNIDPQNSGFEDDESVQRTMQAIRENEDFLADTLIGEEKKRFLDFADAWSAFNGDSTLDGFVTGFRLGAKFVLNGLFLPNEAITNLLTKMNTPTLSQSQGRGAQKTGSYILGFNCLQEDSTRRHKTNEFPAAPQKT